jgi:hypothetical protein
MRASDRENIGVLEEGLKKRRKLTVGVFFYIRWGRFLQTFSTGTC